MGRENLEDMGTDRRIIFISQSTRCQGMEWLQLAEIVSSGWFFENCNRPSRSV
jgi:hypothetical protein